MKKSIWAILVILTFTFFTHCNVKAVTPENEGVKQYKVLPSHIDRGSRNLYNEKVEAIQVFNNEGRFLYVSNNDIDLMAKVVYAESNAEPYEGKVAVASVILNRLRHREFPKTVEGVIKQKNAFSCVVNGNITANPNKDCYNAVFDALDGKDPTTSALYFYNPRISRSAWMFSIKKQNIKTIGNHVFFVAVD